MQEGKNRRCVCNYDNRLRNCANVLYAAYGADEGVFAALFACVFPELPFMISAKFISYHHLCSGKHFS